MTSPFLEYVLTKSPMPTSLMGIFFPDFNSTLDLDGKQVDCFTFKLISQSPEWRRNQTFHCKRFLRFYLYLWGRLTNVVALRKLENSSKI